MRSTLTARSVAQLRPPTRGIYSWHPDALLPSFGLRIYTTGKKAWGITRRWHGAKHPSFRKIGEFPALGLAGARAKARAILAEPDSAPLVRGPDARVSAPGVHGPDTLAALAEQFLEHGRTKRGRVLREATLKEYRRALTIYAADLRGRPVREIRRGDVAAVIRTVAKERGTTTAMRTRAALSRFWSWLIANDYVDANVVAGTEGYTAATRSRVLTDGELAELWAATEAGDFGLIIRLCLWTGCRRSEAGGMRWSELENGVWTVPGARTKNHRPLVLPLPRQAQDALQGHPRWVGRDLVFGRGPTGFQAWSKSKERLDRKLGLAPWDLHDLRRSVQTRLLALGVNRDLVNRLLNHAMSPLEAAYDRHDYLREKGAALDAWAREIERILGRGESKVVALR
jgi:integrase